MIIMMYLPIVSTALAKWYGLPHHMDATKNDQSRSDCACIIYFPTITGISLELN